MTKRLAFYALLVIAGALLAYVLIPNEPIIYSEVVVPARAIEEREPPTEPTIIERVRFITIPPRQVATAPGGAQSDVQAFCAPSVARVTGDTAQVAETLLIRSGTHSPGWWFGKDRLLLTGPTSTGDLKALDFEVRPGFDFRVNGDSVLVRYNRTGFLRQAAEIAVPLFVGGLIGRAMP